MQDALLQGFRALNRSVPVPERELEVRLKNITYPIDVEDLDATKVERQERDLILEDGVRIRESSDSDNVQVVRKTVVWRLNEVVAAREEPLFHEQPRLVAVKLARFKLVEVYSRPDSGWHLVVSRVYEQPDAISLDAMIMQGHPPTRVEAELEWAGNPSAIPEMDEFATQLILRSARQEGS